MKTKSFTLKEINAIIDCHLCEIKNELYNTFQDVDKPTYHRIVITLCKEKLYVNIEFYNWQNIGIFVRGFNIYDTDPDGKFLKLKEDAKKHLRKYENYRFKIRIG